MSLWHATQNQSQTKSFCVWSEEGERQTRKKRNLTRLLKLCVWKISPTDRKIQWTTVIKSLTCQNTLANCCRWSTSFQITSSQQANKVVHYHVLRRTDTPPCPCQTSKFSFIMLWACMVRPFMSDYYWEIAGQALGQNVIVKTSAPNADKPQWAREEQFNRGKDQMAHCPAPAPLPLRLRWSAGQSEELTHLQKMTPCSHRMSTRWQGFGRTAAPRKLDWCGEPNLHLQAIKMTSD